LTRKKQRKEGVFENKSRRMRQSKEKGIEAHRRGGGSPAPSAREELLAGQERICMVMIRSTPKRKIYYRGKKY